MSNDTIRKILDILRDSKNIIEAASALGKLLGSRQVTGLTWHDDQDMRSIVVNDKQISPYTHSRTHA